MECETLLDNYQHKASSLLKLGGHGLVLGRVLGIEYSRSQVAVLEHPRAEVRSLIVM